MPAVEPHGLFQKFAIAARADPKKAAVLAALLLLMGLAWTRWVTSEGPARASAATVRPPVAVTSDSPKPTTKVSSGKLLREWAKGPVGALSRNLFYINPALFPPDGTKSASSVVVEHGFWDELAKSLAWRSEEESKRQQRVDAFKWQAAQLHLQSILLDAQQPKALVDGQLLKEGDMVANFRVLKISARGIVLEREGIKLEVQFK
jgi:hypothetical protein